MKIIIENPSVAVLTAIAAVMQKETEELHAAMGEALDLFDKACAAHEDARIDAMQTDEHDFGVGDKVHWKGQKYEFDGVIVEFLEDGLRLRRDDTGKVVRLTDDDLANPANSLTPLVEAVEDTPLRSWGDVLTLEEGMSVHWQGQKYAFDGVVEKTEFSEFGTPDDKVLFIRRDDTGKLVSLTMNDLQVGRLTLA